jgi:hypothetical protein
MVCISIAINFLGGSGLSIEKRGAENAVVIAMVPAAIAPLVWRARWIQRVTERPNVGSTPAIPRKIRSSGDARIRRARSRRFLLIAFSL